MNEIFEKIYNDNNTDLNESSALFEKVYTEAEMLNEMNPKLRALLAAGLIGTASLGAASCSMPTDDPTGYEQPAPETTNPDNPGDNGGDTKETATFKSLGVEDYAESLARAIKLRSRNDNGEVIVSKFDEVPITAGNTVYIYRNGHFELASSDDEDAFDDASELKNVTYICYKESNIRYFVPENKVDDFDAAIEAYKGSTR